MTNSFQISVIIPTFNRVQWLERALRSVFTQTLQPYEVIVVDDGSTDTTRQMITAQFADQVRYYYQANKGVSAARNAGIQQASGNWIALLDSDDAWLPEKLQCQVTGLQLQPGYRFCHTDEIWYRNGRRVNPMKKHKKTGGHIFKNCLPLCVISPSSALIHHECFDDMGLFDESLPACEDYDYWLRYCARYPVLYIDKPLLIKNGGHTDQLSRRYWGMDRFRVQALLKLVQSNSLPESYQRAAVHMIDTKCSVLEVGARKHNNDDILNYCLQVRQEIQSMEHIDSSSCAAIRAGGDAR